MVVIIQIHHTCFYWTGYSWTVRRMSGPQQLNALDRQGLPVTLNFTYTEANHDCSEDGLSAALRRVLDAEQVHYVLGGVRQTAVFETQQVGQANTCFS